MSDTPVKTVASLKETPRDGTWYNVPLLKDTDNADQFFRWNIETNKWNWMVLRKDNSVIGHGIFEDGVEEVKL